MEVLTETYRKPDERLFFGELALDLANREVVVAGEPRRLEPRAAQLLALLIRSPGAAVSRSDLIDALDEEAGSDEALSQAMARLRRVLGDDARAPRFIATVPKLGYRWIAPAGAAGDKRPVASPRRRLPARWAWGAAALSASAIAGVMATVAVSAAATPPRQFKTVVITRAAGQTTTQVRTFTTAHPERDADLVRIERGQPPSPLPARP